MHEVGPIIEATMVQGQVRPKAHLASAAVALGALGSVYGNIGCKVRFGEAARVRRAAATGAKPNGRFVVEILDIRCLIPGFDGAVFSREWKDALWAKFSTGAPQRQRQSVERSRGRLPPAP